SQVVGFFGVDAPRWLLDSPLNTFVMIVASTWQGAGVNALLFGIGLQSIPKEPLEAARVDGASGFTLFRTMSWPMLTPLTTVVVGLSIVGSLKTFDIVWGMTKGGPGGASETLALTMFKETFQSNQYGLGAAVAVFLTVVTVAASIIYLRRQLAPGPSPRGPAPPYLAGRRRPPGRARDPRRDLAGAGVPAAGQRLQASGGVRRVLGLAARRPRRPAEQHGRRLGAGPALARHAVDRAVRDHLARARGARRRGRRVLDRRAAAAPRVLLVRADLHQHGLPAADDPHAAVHRLRLDRALQHPDRHDPRVHGDLGAVLGVRHAQLLQRHRPPRVRGRCHGRRVAVADLLADLPADVGPGAGRDLHPAGDLHLERP